MKDSPLHERLSVAAGDMTYRHLGELTNTHPETVRRYMQGQSPSAEFLSSVCEAMHINGNWLLTGRGPMRTEELRTSSLREATPTDLLTAIAGIIEQILERLGRLEGSVNRLDAQSRGAAPVQSLPPATSPTSTAAAEISGKPRVSTESMADRSGDGQR